MPMEKILGSQQFHRDEVSMWKNNSLIRTSRTIESRCIFFNRHDNAKQRRHEFSKTILNEFGKYTMNFLAALQIRNMIKIITVCSSNVLPH